MTVDVRKGEQQKRRGRGAAEGLHVTCQIMSFKILNSARAVRREPISYAEPGAYVRTASKTEKPRGAADKNPPIS